MPLLLNVPFKEEQVVQLRLFTLGEHVLMLIPASKNHPGGRLFMTEVSSYSGNETPICTQVGVLTNIYEKSNIIIITVNTHTSIFVLTPKRF